MIRPDRIHLHARKLYQNLSLPSLPTANVSAIGNELLKRLKLPGMYSLHVCTNAVMYCATNSELSGVLEEAAASTSLGP